jgi:hypothetical protein
VGNQKLLVTYGQEKQEDSVKATIYRKQPLKANCLKVDKNVEICQPDLKYSKVRRI